VYRIDLPSFRRSVAVGNSGVNTDVQVMPDGQGSCTCIRATRSPTRSGSRAASSRITTTPRSTRSISGRSTSLASQARWAIPSSGGCSSRPASTPPNDTRFIYLIHGGPQSAWADYWGARWNYALFASRGYVVAAVNFHGSTGYGQKFTDAIPSIGRLSLPGSHEGPGCRGAPPLRRFHAHGRGRCVVRRLHDLLDAGHTNRFKTLVSHDGVFNPVSMAGTTEELWFMTGVRRTPYANRALYEKWSPFNFVQNWKTPILIVHSQLDYRVDLSEGYQAFTAAKLQGVPAKFCTSPMRATGCCGRATAACGGERCSTGSIST